MTTSANCLAAVKTYDLAIHAHTIGKFVLLAKAMLGKDGTDMFVDMAEDVVELLDGPPWSERTASGPEEQIDILEREREDEYSYKSAIITGKEMKWDQKHGQGAYNGWISFEEYRMTPCRYNKLLEQYQKEQMWWRTCDDEESLLSDDEESLSSGSDASPCYDVRVKKQYNVEYDKWMALNAFIKEQKKCYPFTHQCVIEDEDHNAIPKTVQDKWMALNGFIREEKKCYPFTHECVIEQAPPISDEDHNAIPKTVQDVHDGCLLPMPLAIEQQKTCDVLVQRLHEISASADERHVTEEAYRAIDDPFVLAGITDQTALEILKRVSAVYRDWAPYMLQKLPPIPMVSD